MPGPRQVRTARYSSSVLSGPVDVDSVNSWRPVKSFGEGYAGPALLRSCFARKASRKWSSAVWALSAALKPADTEGANGDGADTLTSLRNPLRGPGFVAAGFAGCGAKDGSGAGLAGLVSTLRAAGAGDATLFIAGFALDDGFLGATEVFLVVVFFAATRGVAALATFFAGVFLTTAFLTTAFLVTGLRTGFAFFAAAR